MFVSRVFRSFKKLEKSRCFRRLNVCFESTVNVEAVGDIENNSRKFLKTSSIQKLPGSKFDNLLKNLFTGTIDKHIFKYPQVIQEKDIDIVLNHGVELENFLNSGSDCQLTKETFEELRKLEVFGLTVPPKYGGAGYSNTEATFLLECSGINSTVARFLCYNENFACKILNEYGTEEQKKKYLPGLAGGKIFMSLAYLENGPLIDLSTIKGYGIDNSQKREFILSGEKKWVHNADIADFFLVMVKLGKFSEEDYSDCVKFNFFIVERNAPGVTVHKLVSKAGQQNNIFEVSLKNVVVPYENLLGNIETNGFSIVKSSMAHNNVTEAALCCNLVKRILHDVILKKNYLESSKFRGHFLFHENLSTLTFYLYALESVIYLVSGRFDSFEHPDLLNESALAKAFAVDVLQIVIELYTEILGRESFKSSSLLGEAVQTLQYYSVFEENNQYLKILNGSEGIIHAASKMNQKVKRLRNPFENAAETYYWNIRGSKGVKLNTDYKQVIHKSLSTAANTLEENIQKFYFALETYLINKGIDSLQNEHQVSNFVDIAAYIYAQIACIARASTAVGYDFNKYENDVTLTETFSSVATRKIKEIHEEGIQFERISHYFLDIGGLVFRKKEYPAEHPLTRTF